MYKCLDCGHIFEEGEQVEWEERHGFDDGLYEKLSGCPLCNGEYEDTVPCKHCGWEHSSDELYDGWCKECLKDQIDYDSFFEHCEDNKESQLLDMFVMSELLGGMRCPDHVSCEFHEVMVGVYKKHVEYAKSIHYDFLESCVDFIMDDAEHFAEWLNEKGVK